MHPKVLRDSVVLEHTARMDVTDKPRGESKIHTRSQRATRFLPIRRAVRTETPLPRPLKILAF